jgi:hypothetical protein
MHVDIKESVFDSSQPDPSSYWQGKLGSVEFINAVHRLIDHQIKKKDNQFDYEKLDTIKEVNVVSYILSLWQIAL